MGQQNVLAGECAGDSEWVYVTDSDLRDAAVKALKGTTVSYPTWQKNVAAGKYKDPSVTQWGVAFDKLAQIGQAAPPVTAPLLDMRATKVTALPVSGLAGQETPADAFKTLTYQNGDISLQPDDRFGRVFKVHMHQNSTWAASSHNPWFLTQVPNSGELICSYNLIDGAEIWTAGSVKLLSPFQAISRAEGWAIIAQLNYEGVSPPVAVEVSKEGFGLDLDGGVFDTSRWTGQNHLRGNYAPLVLDRWVDFN